MPNLHMLRKQKNPSLFRKLTLWTFVKLLIVLSGKSAVTSLFNSQEVLSSTSDKAKVFVKYFSNDSNIDDLGISLSVFPSIANLKLH